MNNNDNDKTVPRNSVPPMSSGTQTQGGPLLETGMMQPPQTPGTLGLIGKYQVVRILGEGGMGQVLLARDPVTDSLVAVKIIKPEFVNKEWAVHRFLTEARHIFKMSHPSIIRVLEVSDRKEGPYFVMPYMTGGSLAQKIKPGEPLPPDTLLPLARQVAEALQYAHARGIIHRDLKTSNILLDPEGRAYLCDFGLLRTFFNDSLVDVAKPRLEGTVPYMSPAIAAGQAEDTRCDIYAFGCLLYEMLTSQPPYQGPSVEAILKQIQAGPPQPIRQLNPAAPAPLVAIAEHAMGRELRDRYATMADVLRDLDRAAQGKEPLGPHGRENGSPLRKKILAALGIVALIGLVASGIARWPFGQWRSHETTPLEHFKWMTNNSAITLTKYTGPGGTVTIPNTINGLPVTSIGNNAFRDYANVTSVTIPNTVTSIGIWAFVGCTGLTNVMIPDGVTRIMNGAFDGCFSLTSVTLPNTVASIGVDEGGRGGATFARCRNLAKVTILGNINSIPEWTFYGCFNLTGVYFKGDAPKPGKNVFEGATNATIYYQPGTTGWGKEFGGRPTAPWNPQAMNATPPAPTAQTPFTFTTNNGALTITKYTGPGGAVTIPSAINGLHVTSIGEGAFDGCAKLTSVTIPTNITQIGRWAFNRCGGLTKVAIPASVTSIGRSAFMGCGLTNMTIPNSVTNVAERAFWGCAELPSVTIPSGVTTIEESAFQNCFGLANITIPDGVRSIGVQAFRRCAMTSVTIPASITNIAAGAFSSCPNLTSVYFKDNAPAGGSDSSLFDGATNVTIYYQPGTTGWGKEFGGRPTAPWNPQAMNATPPAPTAQTPFTFTTNNGVLTITKYTGPGGAATIPSTINGLPVTHIGDGAFYDCRSLASLMIPSSVTEIGHEAFGNWGNLTNIAIPDSVSRIGDWAFKRCSISSVNLPASLTRIEEATFWGCLSLTNITIPAGVRVIGSRTFERCPNLTSVYCKGDAPDGGSDLSIFGGATNATVYYLPGTKGWAKTFGGRPAFLSDQDYLCTMETNTITIAAYKGAGGAVTMPSKINGLPVTRIGESAFRGCSTLTSITIPSSVRVIDAWTFLDCSSLTSLTIPNSVTNIGEWAFARCVALTNVVLSSKVTAINGQTFWFCYGLTEITIPNGVTKIGRQAFKRCPLITVKIPDGVKAIEEEAFSECKNLARVTVPSSVTSIGQNAFASCSGLNSITVDAANPSYCSSEDGVLFNKEKTCLVSYPGGKAGNFDIPSSVTKISDAAFQNCTYLTSVTIPDSVTMIDTGAFSGCHNLTGIYFKGDAPRLGQDVFAGLKKAKIYHLPEAKGWGPEFGDFPTAPWTPPANNTVPSQPSRPLPATTNNHTGVIVGGAGLAAGSTGASGPAVPPARTVAGVPAPTARTGAVGVAAVPALTREQVIAHINEQKALLKQAEEAGLIKRGTMAPLPALPAATRTPFTATTNNGKYGVIVGGAAPAPGAVPAVPPVRPLKAAPAATNAPALPAMPGVPSAPVRPQATAAPTPVSFTTNNGATTLIKYNGSNKAPTIPSTIKWLPITNTWENAFRSCTNLTSPTIPNSATSIEASAFHDGNNLTMPAK